MTTQDVKEYIEDLIGITLDLDPEISVREEEKGRYLVVISGDSETMPQIVGTRGTTIKALIHFIKRFAIQNGVFISVLTS